MPPSVLDDVRTRRRDQTRAESLAAAWQLAEGHGIAGLSLRELAREGGMRAPSLYTYFGGKAAVCDERLAPGYRQLDAAHADLDIDVADPVGSVAAGIAAFLGQREETLDGHRHDPTVDEIRPISRTTDAREMALTVYEPSFDLLEGLGPDEWTAATERPWLGRGSHGRPSHRRG